MVVVRGRRWVVKGIWFLAVCSLLGSSFVVVQQLDTPSADAGVHEASSTTRYREIWIDHDEFRGIKDPKLGCEYDDRRWFAEPTPSCGDYGPLQFDIDSLDGVAGAEVFFDLWRSRNAFTAKFRVNDSGTMTAPAGDQWSRTPVAQNIDVSDLRVGPNDLILEQTSAYHLHDAAIRLFDLNGQYPTGSGITSVTPAPSAGVLTVGSDETITLEADVAGADAVEFIAYYAGFDEDNDGQRLDWHAFTRTNWHPGGASRDESAPVDGYGTIGHVGTVHSDGTVVLGGTRIDNGRGGFDGDRTWTIDFDTSLVPNGSPLRFKVRALRDDDPNPRRNDGFWVVDALGGPTALYELDRAGTRQVDHVIDPDFFDEVLHHNGSFDDKAIRELDVVLTNAESVHLMGNYWEQPRIFVNPPDPDASDCGVDASDDGYQPADHWVTSVSDVTADVVDGTNVICYLHDRGFGEFIENPGPMLVVRRSAPVGADLPPSVDAGGPYVGGVDQLIALDGVGFDDGALSARWSKASGPGTVTFTDDDVFGTTARFARAGTYVVQLAGTEAGGGTRTVDRATVTVTAEPVPPSVDAGGPYVVAEEGTLDLDATVSDDGPVTVVWAEDDGPGDVTFGDPTQVDTTATFTVPGAYRLVLTAYDGQFPSVPDTADVLVDAAPSVDVGGDRSVGLPDTLALTATVVDPDGTPTMSWSATGPAEVDFGDGSAASTSVTFTTAGTYELTLTADDGTNPAAADSLVVQVLDASLPDLPPTADAGDDVDVERPAAAVLDGSVTDDGDAATATWSLVSGPGDVDFADSSAPATTATFSAAGTYVLRLTADDGVNAPVTDDVTVEVTVPGEPADPGGPADPGDPTDPPPPVGTRDVGYWMGDGAGRLYEFGDAGVVPAVGARIVAVATTPDGAGPWVLTDDGVVHALGGTEHHGDVDLDGLATGERPAALSVLPDGSGYWVFTDRGRAVHFGAAADLEDLVDLGLGGILNGPVVDSAAAPDGLGAYLVAADGGVFAIGTASFEGSMGGIPLNAPVSGVAVDPDGDGYWLVAADGGIFAFEADFLGSMGGRPLNAPVVGAVAFGDGYLLVAADGGLFNFSDQDFLGSLGDDPPAVAVTAVAGFPS